METIITEKQCVDGAVYYKDRTDDASLMEWNKHPEYAGVYLKHVIKGKDTGGLFSAHIVKIDPDCRLERHCHENQLEMHEIIDGGGVMGFDDRRYVYEPGKMSVIQKGEFHTVSAGEKGMTISAKFFPALI